MVISRMKNIDRIIEQVDGSMRIEGMPLSETDKDRIRRCVHSEKLVEAEIQALVKKYTSPAGIVHDQRL